MKAPRLPHFADVLCLLLGPICMALAVGNYNDQGNLTAAVGAFPLISEDMAPWVASWIWAVQFVFGLFVMVPQYRRFASLGLAAMFLCFLTVALYRVSDGAVTTASFFTKYDPLAPNPGACVVRDALFATGAIVIYLCYFPRLAAHHGTATDTTDSPLTRPT
jgi:hypothetical protein